MTIAFGAKHLGIAIFGAVIIAAMPGIPKAQTKAPVGPQYGTHNPQTCPSLRDPVKGLLTAALATKYFACETEWEMDYSSRPHTLVVLDEVKLSVGKPVTYVQAYGMFPSLRLSKANINELIYPIQGSYKLYTCGAIAGGNAGKNCSVSDNPQNAGVCDKQESGDWRCVMQPVKLGTTKMNVAPPKWFPGYPWQAAYPA